MKSKKQATERESTHSQHPHSHISYSHAQPLQPNSQRKSNPSKPVLTKRREQGPNKENQLQITEPLDPNPITYPSKEFVLSRESLQNNSRSSLNPKDLNSNPNLPPQKSKEMLKYEKKEQELFDRRLSLKCTGNYSQQISGQKSQRLSMVPLRRDSISTQFAHPQSLVEERDSISSVYQNSLFCSDSKSKQTLKKEAIITNLMHKLDHQEDLRSIIQLKLKTGGSTAQQHSKDKRNQSYMTDFTEETNGQSMVAKLKQCESQIGYFKTVIRQMSEKILELTQEKRFGKKRGGEVGESSGRKEIDVEYLLRRGSGGQEHCRGCRCNGSKDYNEGRVGGSIGVQAGSGPCQSRGPSQLNQSSDFLDNLQRTLKVLDGRRN